MTVTLHLKPELEANISAQAQARGMTLEAYLRSLVESAVTPAPGQKLSPEEWTAAFKEWSASHRDTPLLSEHAISRESIYEGRDR